MTTRTPRLRRGPGRSFLTALLLVVLLIGWEGASRAAGLDLDKAVRVGSGPTRVIEFTDPDCPYCRSASRYLDGRSDLTRFVFFYPLPRHPRAREKVRYILSQADRTSAYHQVMAGRLDDAAPLGITAAGIRLQQEHLRMATDGGVRSTPTFIISGRILTGFDVKNIEALLGR